MTLRIVLVISSLYWASLVLSATNDEECEIMIGPSYYYKGEQSPCLQCGSYCNGTKMRCMDDPTECTPRCQCKDGYFFNGTQCVPSAECGVTTTSTTKATTTISTTTTQAPTTLVTSTTAATTMSAATDITTDSATEDQTTTISSMPETTYKC